MARTHAETPVMISILDRLIDLDPKRSDEAPMSRMQSLRKLKAAVRRDLEWLLNTRQPVAEAPEGTHLENSLFTYGLPDITSLTLASLRDRQRLTHAIEEAVAKFEPRIANPRVTLLSAEDEKALNIRFLIEGMLRVDPRPEHVQFDTLLDLSSKEYRVQGESGAR